MNRRWHWLSSVGEGAIVSAIAVVLLACGGAVLSAAEVKPSGSGALPVLVFQTGGKAVQDRSRVPAFLTVLLPEDSGAKFSIDEGASGPAELSARGNSSFHYPKKSYRLELQDNRGKDRKTSLLGLPADSDWVLYASVTDKTFSRNLLAHELWRSMGRYAVRWRFVEVFNVTNSYKGGLISPAQLALKTRHVLEALSGSGFPLHHSNTVNEAARRMSDSYLGVFVLMEKIKRSNDRVNIARLRPEHDKEPELSGGYIFKKDDEAKGEAGLLTGQELLLRFEEPKERDLTAIQSKWVRQYLGDFEKTLFSLGFRNAETGYRNYIDVESFVDFHWMVELSRNADGYFLSQYMHKDRGGKVAMGPLWDWDNAFGNTFFAAAMKTNEWRFEGVQDPDYTWFRRLFEDPDFLQRYMDRWSELRTNVFETTNLVRLIDFITSGVLPALGRNHSRWAGLPGSAPSNELFQKDVSWLKQWVTCRLAWIDSQEYPKPVLQPLASSNGISSVSMGFLDGRLFYTTNGTDPRAPGGAVFPSALEYSKPVEVAGRMTIKARARSKFGLWSAPIDLQVGAMRSGVNIDEDLTGK